MFTKCSLPLSDPIPLISPILSQMFNYYYFIIIYLYYYLLQLFFIYIYIYIYIYTHKYTRQPAGFIMPLLQEI